MDDSLQRLLDAEIRAEQIARQAEQARETLVQGALKQSRAEDERFDARIPELHASFVEKAETRAEQTVKELRRRYDERHAQLRDLAEEKEADALEAAFQLLLSAELES